MKIFKHLRSEWFRYGFETLAVVIGILAAFALENWNEERQFKDQTFVGLQSTAKLGLLEPWLQEHLLELNELQLDYDRSIGGDTRMYLDQTMFYNQSYPFNDRGHVESDSKLADAISGVPFFDSLRRCERIITRA